MMLLPGGLIRAGQRRCDFKLAAPNGYLKLALTDQLAESNTHPGWTSRALLLVLEELAGEQPTLAEVDALCTADRQWLAIAWRLHCAERPQQAVWFNASCQACGSPYDFSLRWQDVPCKAAGEGFPFADVQLSIGSARFRVPDGRLQQQLALCSNVIGSDDIDLRRFTTEELLLTVDGQPLSHGQAIQWHEDDLDLVEAALEAVSPELGLTLSTQCPECGTDQQVSLDPYSGLAQPVDTLLADIHRLASHYHWSESAILALPDQRRRHYLQLIDRDQGLHGQGG